MISYAYCMKSDLERIGGVFTGIPLMTLPCRIHKTIIMTGEDGRALFNKYERILQFNAILVVETRHLAVILDRLSSFGIQGLRWRTVTGNSSWREWAYRTQDGRIRFRIGFAQRKPTVFRAPAPHR